MGAAGSQLTGGARDADLDLPSANGTGPGGLSRAAYARKVFVAAKTGYLTKKSGATQHGGGGGIGKIKFLNYVFKKRYFVLTGESLMYHHDHRNLDDPLNSKEIIFDEHSVVSVSSEAGVSFGFDLVADGKVTHLGAKDEAEREEWIDAIRACIQELKGTTRGYLMKLRAGVPTPASAPVKPAPLGAAVTSGDFKHVPKHFVPDTLLEGKGGIGEWARKYFVVNGGRLTFHASHSSTLVVQGRFKLPHSSQVEVRAGLLLVIRNESDEMVCKAETEEDAIHWMNVIKGAIQENARRRELIMEAQAARGEDPLATTFDLEHLVASVSPAVGGWSSTGGGSGDQGGESGSEPREIVAHGEGLPGLDVVDGGGALLKGELATRPKTGDGPWRPAHYVLEKGRLLVFEDRHHVRPKQVHKISPSCSVFETNLKAFSFEVVVTGLVLHLQGSSFEDSLRWIATLKAAINNSPPDASDPLLAEALRLEDTFYYADFETKQPLGVVLERSKEWAIVKLANPELSHVSVGSALASVNGESVVLRTYEETIGMLTGWKPPLNLIFRRAPVKEGWLKKAGVSKKKANKNKLKNVWVDLREGKLSWYKLGPGGTLLGAMPMIGSAVALVDERETGIPHCLSVVAGVTSAIFQALTRQDAISWASHLYQASAVANGGGYLLEQERDQEVAYEEERRRRLEQEAAERERFARSKKNNLKTGEKAKQQQQEERHAEEKQAVAKSATALSPATTDPVQPDDEEEAAEAAAAAVAAARSDPQMTATLTAESSTGPSGFSTAATPVAEAEDAESGSDGERSIPDAADAAADVSDEGDEGESAGASPPAAAAAAGTETSGRLFSVGRPTLSVEVGDDNGSSGDGDCDVDGDRDNGGDNSSRRRDPEKPAAAAATGRHVIERKPSSVMDLIREREEAAKLARLPPAEAGRRESPTLLSPSLAAARMRPKVDARPWLGSGTPTTVGIPFFATTPRAGTTPRAATALDPVAGAPGTSVPPKSVVGGDSATVETTFGEAGSGAGGLALSPSMAAARTRKSVDRSVWNSASSAGKASVGGSASLVSSCSNPVLRNQSSFNSAGQQARAPPTAAVPAAPAAVAAAGASAASDDAASSKAADVPVLAGFAAAKAMFASTGGIPSNRWQQPPQAPSSVSKARNSNGAAAAAYARAAVTTGGAGAPAPTRPWDKKPIPSSSSSSGGPSAPRAGGGGGSSTSDGLASWGTGTSSPAAAAAVAKVATAAGSSRSGGNDSLSPSAGGGSSLSPVTRPDGGGAAVTGPSASRARPQNQPPPPAPTEFTGVGTGGIRGGGGVRAARDVFASSSGGTSYRPTGGVALAGFGATVPSAEIDVVPTIVAPPPESRPVGGPWDEEEVLKWVRDVTKLDIDPECGVAYSLKDGVALCRLMSKLQPGAAITAPSESSLAYKQMANITIFRRSCRTLGLGDSAVFETEDLFEENDIPAVVKTLVALGGHARRACPAFQGPHLDLSKFAWASSFMQPAANTGAGADVGISRKRSGGVGNGVWPHSGTGAANGSSFAVTAATTTAGSSGNGKAEATWRRTIGGDCPVNSGDEDSSEYDGAGDSEDSEDYGDSEVDLGASAGSAAMTAANGGSASRTDVSIGGGEELTDEMLAKAFDSVEVASQSGGLTPIQFSTLWRSLSGERQNFFNEMKMFQKFNTSGNSVVDFEEFKAGIRLLAKENAREHEKVLRNLRNWTDSQPAAF